MIAIKTAALLIAAAATPVVAQTSGPAAPPKAEKKLCRSYEETGSIMGGKKICHTKAEWTAIDQRNGDNASASRDVNGHAGGQLGGRAN